MLRSYLEDEIWYLTSFWSCGFIPPLCDLFRDPESLSNGGEERYGLVMVEVVVRHFDVV